MKLPEAASFNLFMASYESKRECDKLGWHEGRRCKTTKESLAHLCLQKKFLRNIDFSKTCFGNLNKQGLTYQCDVQKFPSRDEAL